MDDWEYQQRGFEAGTSLGGWAIPDGREVWISGGSIARLEKAQAPRGVGRCAVAGIRQRAFPCVPAWPSWLW